MITIRHSNQRGHYKIDWLNSYHTFSFGHYYDPNHMGLSHLRVINEDTVQANQGFGRHPHKDMEIISYVIEGSLEHKDSMGTGSIIRPGEIQRMSAGTGVEHSEFNHSSEEPLHFLQIWIIPEKNGIQPSYEQKTIHKMNDQFILIGSPKNSDHAIKIHQDVMLYAAYTTTGSLMTYELKQERCGWLQLIKGKIALNGQRLSPGDGAAIQNESSLTIESLKNSELLFFDLKNSPK